MINIEPTTPIWADHAMGRRFVEAEALASRPIG
jgi:hypothetical protein